MSFALISDNLPPFFQSIPYLWPHKKLTGENKFRSFLFCFKESSVWQLAFPEKEQTEGKPWKQRKGRAQSMTMGWGGIGGRMRIWLFSLIKWPVVAKEDCEITSESQAVHELGRHWLSPVTTHKQQSYFHQCSSATKKHKTQPGNYRQIYFLIIRTAIITEFSQYVRHSAKNCLKSSR